VQPDLSFCGRTGDACQPLADPSMLDDDAKRRTECGKVPNAPVNGCKGIHSIADKLINSRMHISDRIVRKSLQDRQIYRMSRDSLDLFPHLSIKEYTNF
jgi:hypothetical protein